MFIKKVEEIWENNKEVICIVGGVCLVIAGSKYLKHMKRLNSINHLIKKEDAHIMVKTIVPMFPNDMPIPEIKAGLDKIEGAKYSDALIAFVNGKTTIFIR